MAENNVGYTNMNGVTHDGDTTCSFQDANCVGDAKKDASITNMNSVSKKEETTCDINNMNCN